MSEYCKKCGTELVDGVCPKCTSEQKNNSEFNKIFMDRQEKFITALGSGYAQNYLLNGSLNKGFVIVSNKRAYFQGSSYEIVYINGKKKIQKSQRSRVVDLNDITGSGYDTVNDPVYKWARWAVLLPPAAIVLLVIISFIVTM